MLFDLAARTVVALGATVAISCGGVPTGPLASPPPMQADRLAITAQRSCLVETTGTVICWGLGEPTQVTPADGSLRFVALRGGYDHLCGLTSDSTAYCWGSNRYGEIGDGSRVRSDRPTRVATDKKFVAITASIFSTCAIDGVGVVYCWGQNDYGAIGTGTMAEGEVYLRPTPVTSKVRFNALAGAWPNCAISSNRRAYCWGSISGSFDPDFPRAPGDCTSAYFLWYVGRQCLVPTPIATELEFAQLAGSRCGLTREGAAFCWGDGQYGTFGNGNAGGYSLTPVPVKGGIQFASITSGATHLCGLDRGGKAFCWGNNFAGQLGIGESGTLGRFSFRTEPTPVLTSERFASIVSREAHTCALAIDQRVWCWGSNDAGQLGPGSPAGFSEVPLPVRLP